MARTVEELEAIIEELQRTNPIFIKGKRLIEAKLKLEALVKADNENSIKAQELETSEEFNKISTNYFKLLKNRGFSNSNPRELQDAEHKYQETFSKIRQLRSRDKGAKSNLNKEILRLTEEIAKLQN